MSGDIAPMSPLPPSPLVRERRHYPGQHKDDQTQQQTSDKAETSEKEAKDVNNNKKNVTVGHIDEYA